MMAFNCGKSAQDQPPTSGNFIFGTTPQTAASTGFPGFTSGKTPTSGSGWTTQASVTAASAGLPFEATPSTGAEVIYGGRAGTETSATLPAKETPVISFGATAGTKTSGFTLGAVTTTGTPGLTFGAASTSGITCFPFTGKTTSTPSQAATATAFSGFTFSGGSASSTNGSGFLAVPACTTSKVAATTSSTATAPFSFSTTKMSAPGTNVSLTVTTTTSSGTNKGFLLGTPSTSVTGSVPFGMTTSAAAVGFGTTTTTAAGGNLLGIAAKTSTAVTSGLSLGMTTTPATTSTTPVGLSLSTVPKTSAAVTTGFSLGITTTSAATTTQITGLSTVTSTTAAPVAGATGSSMNFRQLEEAINKWTLELEEQEKVFLNQATQVNAWDRLLISNGEKIIQLNGSVDRVKLDQQRLDHELDFIRSQQRELEELLVPLEKAMESAPPADMEREHTYQLSESIDSQLKRMAEDLKEIIEHLNAANRIQDSNDPIVQIGRILNAHMDSLQWINQNTEMLQRKLEEVTKLHEVHKRDQERSFHLAYD